MWQRSLSTLEQGLATLEAALAEITARLFALPPDERRLIAGRA